MIVKSGLFNFNEAILHQSRSISADKSHLGLIRRLLLHIDSLYHATCYDRYGVLRKDYLVMGNDHLMNAIIAFVIARQGKSVLVVDDGVSQDNRISGRYSMSFPEMGELISGFLSIELKSSEEIMRFITMQSREFRNADGDCLVHQLNAATIAHHKSDDIHSFWADPVCDDVNLLGFDEIRFWSDKNLIDLKSDEDNFPRFRAEFKSIILTSASQYTRLKSFKTPVIAVGDAKNPLADFEYYRASDRLREIMDTIKVLSNVEDVSAAG